MKRLFMLLMLLAVSGCTNPQMNAHKTLKIVQATVIAGMTEYRTAVKAGEATPGDPSDDVSQELQAEVHAAYSKYYVVFNAALDAAQHDYNTTASANVIFVMTTLLELLEEFENDGN